MAKKLSFSAEALIRARPDPKIAMEAAGEALDSRMALQALRQWDG
jgi:hypothetical protein